MKYDSSITYHSKVMANINGFCRGRDRQAQYKPYAPVPLLQGGIKNDFISKKCFLLL